jgi:hypothetical protein
MFDVKLIIAAIVLCVTTLIGFNVKHHYKTKWQNEIHSTYKSASDMANIKSWRDLVATEQQLKKERDHHAIEIAKHEEKFNRYVADVRAGRIAGLRVTRTDLCTASAEKATGTSGTIEDKTVRLPRAIEEGLFRFAHDRDQIILDFEAFKQEVRIAKCFAD